MAVSYDFNSIKNRLIENLRKKSEWSQFLEQGVAVNLIEAIAQELAYEMQGKEYYTFENWWGLARNKSSLLAESPCLGYIIPRKQGASGTLKISTSKTFDAPPPQNIQIPKYFQFSNGSSYFCYTSDTPASLTTADNYIEIFVRQGQAKSNVFTAIGNEFETYDVLDGNVDNLIFDLTVDNVSWTHVDNIFEASAEEQVYQIYTDPSLQKITLIFGDGNFGKKLITGQTVSFHYLSTSGSLGNVYISDSITTVESQVVDNNSNPIPLYCTNTTALTGGQDYPTLEQIRALGPKVFQTGDRASSIDDFTVFITNLGLQLSKLKVWGIKEYLEDNSLDAWTYVPLEENMVHIAALDSNYDSIHSNTALKNTIIEAIRPKCDPTVIMTFDEVEKIPLVFTVSAVASNKLSSIATIQANIRTTLQNNYGLEYMDFYENIYYSDFISLVDSVQGVRNHLSSIYAYKEIDFDEVGTVSRASTYLPLIPIKSASVKIYMKAKTEGVFGDYIQIGEILSGNTVSSVNNYITSGSIDPASGLLVLSLSQPVLTPPASDYKLKITYECNNLDLILTISSNRKNIMYYDSSSISVVYP